LNWIFCRPETDPLLLKGDFEMVLKWTPGGKTKPKNSRLTWKSHRGCNWNRNRLLFSEWNRQWNAWTEGDSRGETVYRQQ
jgi:hypothetical protein